MGVVGIHLFHVICLILRGSIAKRKTALFALSDPNFYNLSVIHRGQISHSQSKLESNPDREARIIVIICKNEHTL